MALREIGATLKLDGEKEFRKGMNDAARGLRVLDSELKASASAFAGNERSLESLTAKGQLFERKVAQQKKVVEALARAVKESGQMYGEASEKTDGYRIKLNNATAALAKMERELEQNSQAMSELGSDTSRAAKMMDKLERKAKEMNASLRKAGEGLGNVGQKMAMGVTAPVIAGIGLATEGTREFRQDLGKLDAAFKTTGHGVDAGRKLFTDFYGIIGEDDTAIEAVNHLAQMTKNQKELADWTTIATGVYASFGDSLPLEGLTEAANETVKVGKVTGPLADALNWVGISEDEVNAKLETLNSEQKRSAYLTDLLTGKYKKIATEYRNMNGVVIEANKAQSGLRLEMADLGNKLEPIVTKVVRAVTKLVDAFNSMPEPMQDMIIKFGLIAAAIGPVLMAVGKAMVFFALFGDKLGGVTKAAGLLRGVIPLLGTVLGALTSPIGLVVVAAAGLVLAFKKLWDTSPKFRNWVRGLADSLQNGLKGAINAVVDQLNWLIEKINKLPGIEINTVGKMTKSSGTTGWADFRKLDGNAQGTRNWKGGPTIVGEQGWEIAWLPEGTDIRSHSESMAMLGRSQKVDHSGIVYHVFQTKDRTTVATIAEDIRQGNRRLPQGVSSLPFQY